MWKNITRFECRMFLQIIPFNEIVAICTFFIAQWAAKSCIIDKILFSHILYEGKEENDEKEGKRKGKKGEMRQSGKGKKVKR